MVILGGSGTFWGPIVGSAIITTVRHQVSIYTDRWLMILGAIYVFTILVAPGGLVRGFWQLTDWIKARRGTDAAAEERQEEAGHSLAPEIVSEDS